MSTLTNALKHPKEEEEREIRENALKPLKTHIQSFGGRKECSDSFKDALGVPIYKLTKRKNRKHISSSAIVSPSARRGTHVECISAGATVSAEIWVHVCMRSSRNARPARYVCTHLGGYFVPAELRVTSVHWRSSPLATTRHGAPARGVV